MDSGFLLDRRRFLTRSATAALGAGAALNGLPPWWKAVAGPFDPAEFERLVPSDKRLSSDWLRSLGERGEPTVQRDAELARIGMPVGGIGCGQLYLGGDGRLWLWDIFNQPPPPDFGDYRGPHYAKPLPATSPIEQGFALRVTREGRTAIRTLDAAGFQDIAFRGQYPVGRVEYRDPDGVVDVDLDAWSPFIPLDVENSSLPLTVLEFTLHNRGRGAVEVELAGWLENATCLGSGRPGRGRRTNAFRVEEGLVVLEQRAVPAPPEPARERRPDLVFDDFERASYERWTATGTAFGSGPVEADRMPEYQGKVGAQGRRLVNTHAAAPGSEVGARDAATGTLTSQPFTLERDYINFLVGGGAHRERTCLNLVIDGQVVLSATGRNDNRLGPRSFDVRAFAGRTAQLQLVDQESGGWGNIGLDEVVFSDVSREESVPLDREEDWGSLGLALLGEADDAFGRLRVGPGAARREAFPADGGRGDLASAAGRSRRGRERAGERAPTAVEEASAPFGEKLIGALGRRVRLGAGRSVKVTFLVAWFFPAVPRGPLGHVTDIAKLRRAYANRFASATEVARYAARSFARLSSATALWRRTWYEDGTLPHWLLERTFFNTSILATATCHWFDNGRFYGWEGTYCCAGTCQHVWQYAQSVGRVFPALERAVREHVDFGIAFHADTGAIDYRAEAHRVVAIDGLAGTLLRTYREHLMSADDGFLRRLWPKIRKSVEHLLARDPDGNGILDGEQYNTLDASWYGEIAWLSSLYCAAVRAGAAMAREVGDTAFAVRCDAVAQAGSAQLVERLFNGEYFVQRLDPAHPEAINTNDGCHIDQVFGQGWAFQVGLPRVLPPEPTRAALGALWRYNFTPDVGVYRDRFQALRGGRWYAMPGEGGLLMCTWPRGGAEKAAGKGDPTFVGYFNECMTGFEYQVASHMVWEGLVEQGLAVTRMIHDRYAAVKRNPYNEVECSSHYARAMASHGVFLAVCGFDYHGPKGQITFAPRLRPDDFRAPFVAAEGWGSYSQRREEGRGFRATLEVRWGRVRVSRLTVTPAEGHAPIQVRVRGGGRRLIAGVGMVEGRAVVTLAVPVVLEAGQSLHVVLP
jgi:non-lysosomal glucosylceramidase